MLVWAMIESCTIALYIAVTRRRAVAFSVHDSTSDPSALFGYNRYFRRKYGDENVPSGDPLLPLILLFGAAFPAGLAGLVWETYFLSYRVAAAAAAREQKSVFLQYHAMQLGGKAHALSAALMQQYNSSVADLPIHGREVGSVWLESEGGFLFTSNILSIFYDGGLRNPGFSALLVTPLLYPALLIVLLTMCVFCRKWLQCMCWSQTVPGILKTIRSVKDIFPPPLPSPAMPPSDLASDDHIALVEGVDTTQDLVVFHEEPTHQEHTQQRESQQEQLLQEHLQLEQLQQEPQRWLEQQPQQQQQQQLQSVHQPMSFPLLSREEDLTHWQDIPAVTSAEVSVC
jgi:hypothetical protein